MKTTILIVCAFSSFFSIGQTKSNPQSAGLKTLTVQEPQSIFPTIEDYNGQYQIEVTKGETIGITTDFLNRIAEFQKLDQETILDLGNGKFLRVAPISTLDANGKGPYSTPFIEK